MNQIASAIVETATGGDEKTRPLPAKNPAAVALGRLGGKVGGKARAAALTGKQRSDIAQKAALARWSKKRTKAK